MWFKAAVVLTLTGVALCRPPIVTPHGNFSTDPISQEDREWLERHLLTHRSSYPPGFKFLYVSQDGRMSPNNRPSGNWIKIVGSPQTPENVLYVAALEVHKMMKLAPSHVFNGVAQSVSGVGIFSSSETVTVFPGFTQMADTPACRGRCDGSCSRTCTFDGRKYSSIGGVTASLSLVLLDNVMCTASDPYHHHDNILVHEFAHTVDKYGLSSAEKQQKETAYNNAKSRGLWRADTYAMANSAEYFGEGTGAYFLVNLQTGGMTDCSYGTCRSETDVRYHLNQRDPQLYALLNQVYTNNRGTTGSGLKICYASG